MECIINGEAAVLPDESHVTDMLATRGLAPTSVVVERNGNILPREHYATTVLLPGDRLEIVHFVGGG